jgi:hypothetical protein
MSKLNLTNLVKEEISKNEAQKIRAGLTCLCPCYCACNCPPEDRMVYQKQNMYSTKDYDIAYVRVNG